MRRLPKEVVSTEVVSTEVDLGEEPPDGHWQCSGCWEFKIYEVFFGPPKKDSDKKREFKTCFSCRNVRTDERNDRKNRKRSRRTSASSFDMEAFLSINHERESPAERQIAFLAKAEAKIHRMAGNSLQCEFRLRNACQ